MIDDFQKITDALEKRGIPLKNYAHFLHQRFSEPSPLTSEISNLNFSNDPTFNHVFKNDAHFPKTPSREKKTYGQYEVLQKLAHGGMGIVYQVYHPGLKQHFALKVLIAGEDASDEALKRFHREIQTTAKLKHPNIVQIIDSGQHGGEHYFVMEYVEGTNLSTLLSEKNAKISTKKGATLIKKCLDALEYAHQQGVIHRDLKPENILMTKEGEPKLTDFGLARDTFFDSNSQKITHSGTIMGTPAYMSPEQASGNTRSLDATSDIYSMGICFYEVITGKRPFRAPNTHTLLYQIVHEDPAPPSQWKQEIHRDIDTIILKAIEKQKEKRYPTAQEFAQDITRFLEGYPILARPVSKREKIAKWIKRNKQIVAVFTLIFFVITGLIAYFQWKHFRFQEDLLHKQNHHLKEIASSVETQIQKSEKVNLEAGSSSEIQFEMLLDALNLVNSGLSLDPKNKIFEQKKFQIGQELIRLACLLKEYRFASYLAQELNKLEHILPQERAKISQKVEEEKTKLLRRHQKRLEIWISRLKREKVTSAEKEDALLEISKMQEEEIFQRISHLVDEATRFAILDKHAHSDEIQVQFYNVFIIAFGRLENPKAAPFLLKNLNYMADALQFYSAEAISIVETNYLFDLTTALVHSKALNVSKPFQEMCTKIAKHKFLLGICDITYQRLLFWEEAHLNEFDNPDSLYTRGIALKKLGDVEGALQDFLQALKLQPNANTLVEIIKIYVEEKEYSSALDHIEKAIQQYPSLAEAYYYRGFIQGERQRPLEAIEDFSIAIRFKPQYAEAHFYRARSYHQLAVEARLKGFPSIENFKKALDDYTLALRYNPRVDSSIYQHRIDCLQYSGNIRQALEEVNALMTQNPKNMKLYSLRATIKQSVGDLAGAIADFTLVIQSKPDDLGLAHYNRGILYMGSKKLELALEDFIQSTIYRPAFDLAFYYQYRLQLALGKPKDANIALEKATQISFQMYEKGRKNRSLYEMKEGLNNILQFAPKEHPLYQTATSLLEKLKTQESK